MQRKQRCAWQSKLLDCEPLRGEPISPPSSPTPRTGSCAEQGIGAGLLTERHRVRLTTMKDAHRGPVRLRELPTSTPPFTDVAGEEERSPTTEVRKLGRKRCHQNEDGGRAWPGDRARASPWSPHFFPLALAAPHAYASSTSPFCELSFHLLDSSICSRKILILIKYELPIYFFCCFGAIAKKPLPDPR